MAERMPLGLDVVGQVMVEMGDLSGRIDAQGDRIVVHLPGFRSSGSTLLKWARGAGRREAIRRLHSALTDAGLTIEVVVGRSTVGLLGVGARSGLASRKMGFSPLEIRVRGLLGSLRQPANRPE